MTAKPNSNDPNNVIFSGSASIPMKRWRTSAIVTAILAAIGVGHAAANWTGATHSVPSLDDRTVALIGKTFAESIVLSNDKLIRSIDATNASTRDLVQVSREQNELCKQVINDLTTELKSIRQEIVNSRQSR